MLNDVEIMESIVINLLGFYQAQAMYTYLTPINSRVQDRNVHAFAAS